jgi:hypothetical protein
MANYPAEELAEARKERADVANKNPAMLQAVVLGQIADALIVLNWSVQEIMNELRRFPSRPR